MEIILVLLALMIFLSVISKSYQTYRNFIQNKVNKLFMSRKNELEAIIKSQQKEMERILEQKRISFEKEIEQKNFRLNNKEKYLITLKESFDKGYINGRKWLANYISEADKIYDEQLGNYLLKKKHPAFTAAEAVKKISADKRAALNQLKLMEYQIQTYKEYFPFLEEFEVEILNEELNLLDNNSAPEDFDRSILFLSKDEYQTLSITERNQLALKRYIEKPKTKQEIGKFYERFIGYKYESAQWKVDYVGLTKKYEDMGRDLVCIKNGIIHIIQAKCWSTEKVIHEKHIFQLFGTVLSYELENNLPPKSVLPIFATTTSLSEIVKAAAKRLGVEVKYIPLEKNYPMIKCNINKGEKIYHLPFDQQYDRIKIQGSEEFYILTINEAEKQGFRRAKRYFNIQ